MRKGKIIGEKVEISVNLGAYPLFTDEIISQIIIGAAGSYTIPNMSITLQRHNYQRTAYVTPSKDSGLSSGVCSTETHISRTAEICSENPGEWRLRYLPGKRAYIPTGGIEREFAGKELLLRVLSESDFHRKYSAYEVLKKHRKQSKPPMDLMRGIGISFRFLLGKRIYVKKSARIRYTVKGQTGTQTTGYHIQQRKTAPLLRFVLDNEGRVSINPWGIWTPDSVQVKGKGRPFLQKAAKTSRGRPVPFSRRTLSIYPTKAWFRESWLGLGSLSMETSGVSNRGPLSH